MRFARVLLALAAGLFVSAAPGAHELTENRATLVLRDRTHVSITLQLRYTEAVHKVLAPQVTYGEFLAAIASLPPSDFEEQLKRAHDALQSGTRIQLSGAPAVQFSHWVWPDGVTAQRLFQQRLMEAVVDSGSHRHEPPVEVRADLVSPANVRSATVEFSRAFGGVLLVWYQPRQAWVDTGRRSPPITFE